MKRILVINTGSTSTKIAVFEDRTKCMEQNIVHSVEVLRQCADLNAQLPLRQQAILAALQAGGQDPAGFDAIAARGGTFGMVQGGAYLVDEALLAACRAPVTSHASNLSAILAAAFAETSGCNAYVPQEG